MSERLLELSEYSLSLIRKNGLIPILTKLSFYLNQGEILGLVGPSGSGKSMTFTAISRLLQQIQPIKENGELNLTIGNQTYSLGSTDGLEPILRGHLGIIFQQSSEMLNPRQTIKTQLLEKMQTPTAKGLDELLNSVGLTPAKDYIEAYPFNLSGGQIQRVLIALALANGPKLLLADEPFSAVDAELKTELSQLLIDLVKERKLGLLLVSHDLELVSRIADKVLFLSEGRIVNEQTELGFGTGNGNGKGNLNQPKVDTQPKEVILSVEKVIKSYDRDSWSYSKTISNVVLDGFCLELRRGEILGISGRSGVGKSTLARLLAGMESYNSGEIKYRGQEISTLDKNGRFQYFSSVQLIPQDPLSRMPAHRSVRAHFEDVFYIKNQPYIANKVEELMELMNLDIKLLNRLPKQLSGGQRQRVLITKALLMDVEILICDEIFSALDFAVQAEIGELLQQLVAHKSLSIIMISHDSSSLEQYCNRVINM